MQVNIPYMDINIGLELRINLCKSNTSTTRKYISGFLKLQRPSRPVIPPEVNGVWMGVF